MTTPDTAEPDRAPIFAALASAQAQMGKAVKDSKNPAFKSTYADLSSVMDACLPALNANGIAVLQPLHDEDGKLYVKTILAHASGATLECRVPLIVGKNDMQGYGSAVTYARRYGLMAMAGIAPDDDDGNAAAKSITPAPEFEPAPHVDAITAAPTGQDLLKVIPGAHADHPAINAAIIARVGKLIDAAPSIAALDKMATAFSPVWPALEAKATARRAALAPVDDTIPY
jgi:hypothetical protein